MYVKFSAWHLEDVHERVLACVINITITSEAMKQRGYWDDCDPAPDVNDEAGEKQIQISSDNGKWD